jgi:hypothetical protein
MMLVGEKSSLHSLTGRVVRKRGSYPETGLWEIITRGFGWIVATSK